MGRYASREEEIDFLLRSKRFVDLYGVVRNGLRASVESYSIKKLEPLYEFTRGTPSPMRTARLLKFRPALSSETSNSSMRRSQCCRGYNRDDCVSTWRLRDWLEARRDSLIASGIAVPRPAATEGAPSEALGDWLERSMRLIERLTADVPADVAERTAEQHARWLLAHTLDWHRREQKALWWEYFRLSGLGAEDLLDERAGLSGLAFVGVIGGTAKAPIHGYGFPPRKPRCAAAKICAIWAAQS